MAEEADHRTLLYESAKNGNRAGLELALRNGVSVDFLFRYSRVDHVETALHAASRKGHFAIVRVLLDAGANINSRDSLGGAPLHDACLYGRLNIARELVQRGADICAGNIHGRTPFDMARSARTASLGDGMAVMEYLLQHYRNDIFESEGRQSLLSILKKGEYSDGSRVLLPIGKVTIDELLSVLRYFVEQDPETIRGQNNTGNLPLHIACHRLGLLEVFRYLLEQDPATLHIANNDGALPIHLACQKDAAWQSIQLAIKYLVEESEGGAGTLCTRDSKGNLPIHLACSCSHVSLEMIEYLVEHSPPTLYIANNNGALPIHMACQFGVSLHGIKYLVEENGGPGTLTASDSNGSLPIHLACSRLGAPFELIQFLVEQDPATLYIANNNSALPIHMACQFGLSLQEIKYLVEENGGAETLQAYDNNGYLPLHTLCQTNNPSLKTVEYLVNSYPAALSTQLMMSGDLPVTLACESASLSVIYTLIRGNPQVVKY